MADKLSEGKVDQGTIDLIDQYWQYWQTDKESTFFYGHLKNDKKADFVDKNGEPTDHLVRLLTSGHAQISIPPVIQFLFDAVGLRVQQGSAG